MTDLAGCHAPAYPVAGHAVSRRTFISGLAVAVAGLVAGSFGLPAVDSLLLAGTSNQPDSQWLTLCPLAALVPGVPNGFPFARKVRKAGWSESLQTGIAYAVTHDGSNVQVLANVCSHGGCRVTWQQERQAFLCPCHEGLFGADGRVLVGPPQRPLEQFPCRVVNGQVQIQVEV